MQVSRRKVQDFEVVALDGTLDAAVAQKVRNEFKEMISSGSSQVIVDLEKVKFIDSSGLSALVTGFKAARAAGGDMALINLAPAVRSIIELTRLHRIMEIFDDEASAVERLSASRV
jgi:anti-sigma B factor antagonist